MPVDRRILWLLVAHLLLGPLCSLVAAPTSWMPFNLNAMPIVLFFAVILCQACLLGSWAALSGVDRPRRIAGLILGTIYLGALLSTADGPGPNAYLGVIPAVASALMAGVICVVRRRWALLHRPSSPPALMASERGLRVSIGSLMLFTVAVAVVAAGFRSLPGALGPGMNRLTVVAWGTCFASVSLSAIGAALATARPGLWGLAVLGLSALVGALFAVSTDARSWQDHVYFVTCHVLEAALFLGSFLVVRSCGYRLQRISSTDLKLP